MCVGGVLVASDVPVSIQEDLCSSQQCTRALTLPKALARRRARRAHGSVWGAGESHEQDDGPD